MDPDVFDSIRRIVHERSGIHLKEGKAKMVSARIARRLRELDLASERDYLDHLAAHADETVQLLNVISTNVTRFFREPVHFDFTRDAVARWVESGQRRLRVWSAASSTGQEPYSIAMTVAQAARRARGEVDFKLLATDISTRVLERARAGVYSPEEVESVPPGVLREFFTESKGTPATFTVKPAIRDRVVFRRLNLNEPPFPMRGPLDLVFCCNVMIYFDATTKRRLLTEAHRLLRPDGYLIVSQTESLTGLTDLFRPVRPSIYGKVASASEAGVAS